MSNSFMNLKKLFKKGERLKPTLSEAREQVFGAICPLLQKEGFQHKKDNNLWRITEIKSDVIEVRFLTTGELEQFKLPQSNFSVLCGCYFTFIPDFYGEKYIHQIDRLITPREVDCHFRFNAIRKIRQSPSKMDQSVWHLSETQEKQKLVLNDVCEQIISDIMPRLDTLAKIDDWIQVLEDEEINNIGIGCTNSLQREFLLGFTYKYIDARSKALSHLLLAKEQIENQNKKLSNYAKELSTDAPIFKQLKIVNNAVEELTDVG